MWNWSKIVPASNVSTFNEKPQTLFEPIIAQSHMLLRLHSTPVMYKVYNILLAESKAIRNDYAMSPLEHKQLVNELNQRVKSATRHDCMYKRVYILYVAIDIEYKYI